MCSSVTFHIQQDKPENKPLILVILVSFLKWRIKGAVQQFISYAVFVYASM